MRLKIRNHVEETIKKLHDDSLWSKVKAVSPKIASDVTFGVMIATSMSTRNVQQWIHVTNLEKQYERNRE